MAIDKFRVAATPSQAVEAQRNGGGAPALAVDPSGLVPVNRSQPLATDGGEAQRMMERRMGTMPPSSFSGAGAGFVPPSPGVGSFADRRTDMANAEMFGRDRGMLNASLSPEAAAAVARTQQYGAPTPNPGVTTRPGVGQAVSAVASGGRAGMRNRLVNAISRQLQPKQGPRSTAVRETLSVQRPRRGLLGVE
jgi:hypothetical protein